MEILTTSEIDPDQLLTSAADGDIEPFRQIAVQQIKDIVTPIKNTVLQINITSEKVSPKFVKEILGMYPSLLIQTNASGDTPLHLAARYELADVVEVLIKFTKAHDQHQEVESGTGMGAACREMLRMQNDKGNTALHEAMQKRCIHVVKILVREDPDFPYSTNHCNETPLYIAVVNGFLEAVVEMLQFCTSVSYEGPNGKTALHVAARRSNPDLTEKILEKKKSLTKEVDDNGWTPLHYAAYYGQFEVTQKLLKFDKSVAYVADKNKNMSPLHLAACQGYKDIMIDILKSCPDCNELVNDEGWNALHFAMATVSKDDMFILLQVPSIKMLVLKKDAKGNTPLHVLALNANLMLSVDPLGDILDQNIGDFSIFNNKNVDAEQVFNNGYPELEQEILALSKDTENGTYPKGLLHIPAKHYDEYLEHVKEKRTAHLVVATLIATVTFAAGFTVLGGFNQGGKNEGTAILSRNSAFQTFVLANTTALVLSISGVFIYFIVSMPMFKKYVFVIELGSWFTVVAMGSLVVAFVTGSYATLSPALGLAIFNCLLGLLFFLLVLPMGYFLILHLFKTKSPFRDTVNAAIKNIIRWAKIFR